MAKIRRPALARKTQLRSLAEVNANKARMVARAAEQLREEHDAVFGRGASVSLVPQGWTAALNALANTGDLGPWPWRLGDLIQTLNGADWSWAWPGTVAGLHKELKERFPGYIGLATMRKTWRAMKEAEIIIETDGGWAVSDSFFLDASEGLDS